jgi:hypothetical protein
MVKVQKKNQIMPRRLNILPIAFCFLLSALAAPAAQAQDCEADFVFQYLEGQMVALFNTSPAYDSMEWVLNGELAGGSAAVIQAFSNDTNYVCLRIWAEDGCEVELCLTIFPGAPGEMCQVTDCVWPGDADGNGRANHYDLLNIGLGYGQAGPERPFFPDPDNHIAWAPNFSWNWGTSLGGIDYKHLDCDGDGFIDEADVAAIFHNYVPEPAPISLPTPDAAPVYLQFDLAQINLSPSPIPDFEVTAGIYVGTAAQPFDGLHGLALRFRFPLELAQPLSAVVEYAEDSFFGPAEEVLLVAQDLSPGLSQGRFDWALSRKGGSSVSGYGRVATVRFIVNGDIIDGRPEPEIIIGAEAEGIVLKGSLGDTIAFGTRPPDTATIVKSTFINTSAVELAPSFQAFPNPARGQLSLRFGAAVPQQISLFNSLGQLVLRRPVAAGMTELELNLTGLPPGLYLLAADWAQGRSAVRVVVE